MRCRFGQISLAVVAAIQLLGTSAHAAESGGSGSQANAQFCADQVAAVQPILDAYLSTRNSELYEGIMEKMSSISACARFDIGMTRNQLPGLIYKLNKALTSATTTARTVFEVDSGGSQQGSQQIQK